MIKEPLSLDAISYMYVVSAQLASENSPNKQATSMANKKLHVNHGMDLSKGKVVLFSPLSSASELVAKIDNNARTYYDVYSCEDILIQSIEKIKSELNVPYMDSISIRSSESSLSNYISIDIEFPDFIEAENAARELVSKVDSFQNSMIEGRRPLVCRNKGTDFNIDAFLFLTKTGVISIEKEHYLIQFSDNDLRNQFTRSTVFGTEDPLSANRKLFVDFHKKEIEPFYNKFIGKAKESESHLSI